MQRDYVVGSKKDQCTNTSHTNMRLVAMKEQLTNEWPATMRLVKIDLQVSYPL